MPRADLITAAQRRELLEQLVAAGDFATQQELVAALADEGVEVTQSSVSRDIATLGLRKIDGRYTLPAAVGRSQQAGEPAAVPWCYIHSVRAAGDHMIVVRCDPATAQQVAIAIDAGQWAGVLGTIAGDDTVFVATESPNATAIARRRLRGNARR